MAATDWLAGQLFAGLGRSEVAALTNGGRGLSPPLGIRQAAEGGSLFRPTPQPDLDAVGSLFGCNALLDDRRARSLVLPRTFIASLPAIQGDIGYSIRCC